MFDVIVYSLKNSATYKNKNCTIKLTTVLGYDIEGSYAVHGPDWICLWVDGLPTYVNKAGVVYARIVVQAPSKADPELVSTTP